MKTLKVPAKFTAALLHENDKNRIIEIRKKLNLTEKDTMTAILDAAEQHMEEMEEAAASKNKIEAEEKEARRKAKYEEFKEAQKEARRIMAAGKVKKEDIIEAEMIEDDDDSEPSID
jgi:tRNA U34 5-carboxymethylaminomethyl modifying enzyme MnmG/GidA